MRRVRAKSENKRGWEKGARKRAAAEGFGRTCDNLGVGMSGEWEWNGVGAAIVRGGNGCVV
jgi:hypothetical protein